ncbi:hypothetical protein C8F01DRAFT_1156993 [Mycena amicta]|nr:hypothetical protein C8F01DRAFT_1156993 [Mycena amicta]
MATTEKATSDRDSESANPSIVPMPTTGFFDDSPEARLARRIYFKTIARGLCIITIIIFGGFSIYWGSVWSTPHHTLPGWIVDFDGGVIGQSISSALTAIDPGRNGISWTIVPASDFAGGISDLSSAVVQEKTWYGLSINSGATANLSGIVSSPGSSYNPTLAITFIGAEARNEHIYAVHSTLVPAQLEGIIHRFAVEFLKNISSSPDFSNLVTTAPRRRFAASAVTFVGLIYLLILSFFIVMVSDGARQASGLARRLSLSSLIRLRLATAFSTYFLISLFYTLVSRAFQLPFSRHFGPGGLVLFWMVNWVGMLALGLALESLVTILTARFTPFFLLSWIIVNVSTAIFPLQVLPKVYHYGFGFPFYNISRAVRAIVFGTKNEVGLNFGVLIAWVGISCVSLPVLQWLVRRRDVNAQSKS